MTSARQVQGASSDIWSKKTSLLTSPLPLRSPVGVRGCSVVGCKLP